MLFDVSAPLSLALQATRIGIEANAVIAMRVAGMAGLWKTQPEEMTRMVVEKAEAAVEVIGLTTEAAMHGHGPEVILAASMGAIHRRTMGNLDRLSRLGPSPVAPSALGRL